MWIIYKKFGIKSARDISPISGTVPKNRGRMVGHLILNSESELNPHAQDAHALCKEQFGFASPASRVLIFWGTDTEILQRKRDVNNFKICLSLSLNITANVFVTDTNQVWVINEKVLLIYLGYSSNSLQ
jgi:hypothetical protein